jgi:hypothetical protein
MYGQTNRAADADVKVLLTAFWLFWRFMRVVCCHMDQLLIQVLSAACVRLGSSDPWCIKSDGRACVTGSSGHAYN